MDVLIIIMEERDPCNRSVHLNGELIRQRVGFRGMFISPVTFQVSLCSPQMPFKSLSVSLVCLGSIIDVFL